MFLVSITRLRVRSVWFLPVFLFQALRTARQARSAKGCLNVATLRDAQRTFWTRTVWEDEAAMRNYMISGVHRKVMPRLAEWCSEASVVHWTQPLAELPSWEIAHERMQRDGRPSKVRHPTEDHLAFRLAPLTVSETNVLNSK